MGKTIMNVAAVSLDGFIYEMVADPDAYADARCLHDVSERSMK